jgi:nitroimidazol reductase NimA-like FMN-containing flavoprotein (pyridoxamine 5'-phosphate oxidase superfamily)
VWWEDPVVDELTVDEQTRVRRFSGRQVVDRAALDEILRVSLIAHVAVVRDGVPVVLPFVCAPDGDALLLHGSTAAGVLRAGREGAPIAVAVAVTVLDGLVVARSAFDNSMNYRSVMVLGVPETLEGEDKARALNRLTDHLLPGRVGEVPPSTRRELAATTVLRLRLDRCSVKVRTGPPTSTADPEDPEGDGGDGSVWAGVLPLAVTAGDPVPSPDVPAGIPVPSSVHAAAVRLRPPTE